MIDQLEEIFNQEGPLAFVLPGYQPREGQQNMARAIARLLFDKQYGCESCRSLVVEAETGIGKTLAYLIPAALSEKKIVVSTATLNLQDQIVSKDIPLVAEAIGQDISHVCIKGRENYICLYRWFQLRSTPELFAVDGVDHSRIDRWLAGTDSGDRAELSWLGERSAFWDKVSAKSSQCLGGNCPQAAECFISRLRKRAGAARIMIVNHHLFFSDLALKKEGYGDLLPRYEVAIFDEAHHIEDIASSFFSQNFSHYQLIDLLNDVEQQAHLDLTPEKAAALLTLLGGLRRRGTAFASIFPEQQGRFHLENFIEDISPAKWLEEVETLTRGFDELARETRSFSGYGEAWSSFSRRSNELAAQLQSVANPQEEESDAVRWYERKKRSVVLSLTPLEIADILEDSLYSTVDVCIMTSATLTSGGSFSYIQKRLGLCENTEYLQFVSPFDYTQKALVYVPEDDFPEPSEPDYTKELCRNVLRLLRISRGRGLVLCTSFRTMDLLAEYLEKHLDYQILVQGSAAKTELLAQFTRDVNSILVAVASFWEGVDVPGESLSCVIIDKLPFEVPSDPVLQMRIEKIRQGGGNPFFEYQVPRAVLSLKQGVGRLIRSVTDAGIIALMDVRLFRKGYGRTFLSSLPPAPISRRVEDVKAFFRGMERKNCHFSER